MTTPSNSISSSLLARAYLIDQIGKAQIIGKKLEKYKVKRGLVNVSVVKIDEQTNKIIKQKYA